MPVTRDQAQHIAALAAACRPHGARRWDEPGILAALAKVKHLGLADVTAAAIRGAADRTLDTPGAIANLQSSCWRERLTEPEPSLKSQPICRDCGRYRTECRRVADLDPDDHHDFTPLPRRTRS